MLSVPARPVRTSGLVTWSGSSSRGSSFTAWSIRGLLVSMQKHSPDSARPIRIVRGSPARSTAAAHSLNASSTRALAFGSSVSIWSRGPVPTVSLASVSTMPLA